MGDSNPAFARRAFYESEIRMTPVKAKKTAAIGSPRPSTAVVAQAVGQVTFWEIVQDKVLYNILICTVLLLGVGVLASRLSFVRPERIILDFGLSALNISCALIATFYGASMLGREFDRRTIYVALARPISRPQFVLGKYAGLGVVILVNWVLMSIAYLAILSFTGGSANPTLIIALLLILMQSWMIAGIAMVFSSISTTSLSVMMTIGMYLIGNNISQIRFVATRVRSVTASATLNALATVLPNLEYFNLDTKVTYGLPVSFSFWMTSLGYGAVISALCLLSAGILIHWKEG